MRVVLFLSSVIAMAASGCAHNKANQYAYAPPLAPPVYPQPQTSAQPVIYPTAAAGPGFVPAAAPAAGMPMLPPITAAGDPCCPPMDGGGMAMPVVYESAEQTPQCPPGP